MSEYMKTMKTYLKSEEYSNHQSQAKYYGKCYSSLLEGKIEGSSSSSDSNANQNNLFSNSNCFNGELIKEKVLKWFFSMSLESRIKIATVENSFIASMIHQMHNRYKADTKIVFQSKPENYEDNSGSAKEKYSFKAGPERDTYSEEENLQANILNFFNFKSNRTESPDSMVENIWLQDVRYFSLHSELDAITLTPRVLKDEGLFLYYFRYAGSPKCFFSLIRPQFDNKTKIHSYFLPDWFDSKDFFSVGQYIAAYIEQAILIKFVLNYNKKDKVVYSLIDDKKMSEFFQKRKEVLGCLSKHFNNESKLDLFTYIFPRRIFNDVAYDKSINNLKRLKNRHLDVGYQNFTTKKFTAGKSPCFFASTDMETEDKIITKYKNEHIIYFVDSTLYHDLNSVWNDNYFISVRLFEDMHCLYTDKNYEELINDMIVNQESKKTTTKKGKKNANTLTTTGNNSKIKKKTTTTAVKSDQINGAVEDPNYEFYSAYLHETRGQNNIINKDKVTTSSVNVDSSPAPKQELNSAFSKDYLYDSYQNGKKNMITDFVKNYIITDIINNAYETAKNNDILKATSTCADLLNDMCKINTTSKMINYYLSGNKDNETKVDDNTVKKSFSPNVSLSAKDSINHYESDFMNKENMSDTISKKNDEENETFQLEEDLVNYLETSKEGKETSNNVTADYENEHTSLLQNESQKNEENKASNSAKNNPKKKKKEPNFFLYDTSKKKKEKTNVVSKKVVPVNAGNTGTNVTSNNSNINNVNVKVNKESEVNKEKEKDNVINTINNNNSNSNSNTLASTNYATPNINEKTKSSPNNTQYNKISTEVCPKTGSNYLNTGKYHANSNSISNTHNKSIMKNEIVKEMAHIENISICNNPSINSNNSNKEQTNTPYSNPYPNNITNTTKPFSYKSLDSPRDKYANNTKYKGSYNTRFYPQREREPSAPLESSIPIVGNNYYIFNSITQVSGAGGMLSPMMMYMNPSIIPGSYSAMIPNVPSSSNSNMRNLVSSINLNKYSNDFLTFVYKLHNDIVSYHRNVNDTLESMKEIKVYVIQYIEKLIKQNISDEFSIDIYGSFASDLSIESSDIDIKIRLKSTEEDISDLNSQFDLEATIMLLVKNFTSLNLFESVMPIYTASVPIIKIVVDPCKVADDENLMRLGEFRNSENYLNYKFNKEEINKIKIDLTFLDMVVKNNFTYGNSNQYNNLMSSVEFAKNKLILYPEVKPLLQVLKRFLHIRKMNSCFNGGLSSFCLYLLILAFIKFKLISQTQLNQNNLGRLLLDFLEFYGRMFNFHGCTIDVNLPNPFVLNSDIFDKSPVILDPLSYLNASKSSYRIDEVKESFAEALDYLNMTKLKYDKIDISPNTSNIIYDLLLKK